MPLQDAVSYFFFGMASISMFCFIFLVAVYWKRERNQKARIKKAQEDIGDITVVFETMRGIVAEQKQLARRFNDDLDKKMAVVKQLLEQSLNRNEELYERQHTLTRELDTMALEMKELQRQLDECDRMLQSGGAPERQEAPALRGDLYETQAPEAPANPEKARDAFRALLDSQEREEDAPSTREPNEQTPPTVQKQVEAYSAAGLSIPEIAEKLDIGQGEVRLLLNLKRR